MINILFIDETDDEETSQELDLPAVPRAGDWVSLYDSRQDSPSDRRLYGIVRVVWYPDEELAVVAYVVPKDRTS